LSTWSKYGPAANGAWAVAPGGNSVTQSINGNPTFFVGPDTYINTTLRGRIRVASTWDDDYIGFVMGYNSPLDNGQAMDFVLFDWKSADQDLAKEGFALSRVQGNITNYVPGFTNHTDSAGFDALATSFGSTLGWTANTSYDFEIKYMSDRVTVLVTGGVYKAPTAVLDVAGVFPEGRFGFYNLSQEGVTYSGYTVEQLPVPEPSSIWMALAGMMVTVAPLCSRRLSKAEECPTKRKE
jgi:hypothetical protein